MLHYNSRRPLSTIIFYLFLRRGYFGRIETQGIASYIMRARRPRTQGDRQNCGRDRLIALPFQGGVFISAVPGRRRLRAFALGWHAMAFQAAKRVENA